MKRIWSSAEFQAHWVLTKREHVLLKGRSETGRLLFSVLLKYFQLYASFPTSVLSFSPIVLEFVADQISVDTPGFDNPNSLRRSMRDYCQEIREYLGVHRFDHDGRAAFKAWLLTDLLPLALERPGQDAKVQSWFLDSGYELPRPKVLRRLFGEAGRVFERRFFCTVVGDRGGRGISDQ